MSKKGPGKSHREGISLTELADLFPDETAAAMWFENQVWPDGRYCGHCGGMNTRPVPRAKPMPYWCTDCRSYFSVRTGTAIEKSRLPLRKWAFAIYINVTSLKSVSSMKLHRDLRVTQENRVVHAAPAARGVEQRGGRLDGGGRSRSTKPTWAAGRRTSTPKRSRGGTEARSARRSLWARRTGPRTKCAPKSSRIPTARRCRAS